MGNNKWSELHLDIFDSILEKVTSSLSDVIHFKAVCSSWNYAIKSYTSASYYYINHDQAPLLMFYPTIEKEHKVCFFSMIEKKVYRMNYALEENGCSYSGWTSARASHGWIVVWDSIGTEVRPRAWLVNPISRSSILLPMPVTLVYFLLDDYKKSHGKPHPEDYDLRNPTSPRLTHKSDGYVRILVALVSSDPSQSNNNNFVVVVIYNAQCIRSKSLAFCKPGDNAWTSLGNYQNCLSIEFNNGQLFTLFSCTKMRIWDLRSGESYDYNNLMKPPIVIRTLMEVVGRYLPPRPPLASEYRSYKCSLVESVGELLLVEHISYNWLDCMVLDEYQKEMSEVMSYPYLDEHGKEVPEVLSYLERVDDGSILITREGKCVMSRSVYYFYIFKLNVSSKKWENVEYLHGRAICLNEDGTAISISTQNFLEFEENSIYFIHKHTYLWNLTRYGVAYNLGTKVAKTFYTYVDGAYAPRGGMWIVPNPW